MKKINHDQKTFIWSIFSKCAELPKVLHEHKDIYPNEPKETIAKITARTISAIAPP